MASPSLSSGPLAIHGGSATLTAAAPHFVWPPITDKIRRAVAQQLESSISIYDRSGCFAEFEDAFADYHARRHALLHSSGTVALLAMYFGAGLGPGDEVLCPAYTFHASVSPLPVLGIRPVFCDCLPDGNIDPSGIAALIGPRTKAVVVTHMWGQPCAMDEITRICRDRRLLLLEDCSHAHGSRYAGRLVGTFGDAAVWSLQGQKTVTGGEGGVLATDNDDIYYRSLALGHYNKRCRQEIPADHPLAKYSLTGFGLKLRAHPLAVAIAKCLLDDLDGIVARRNAHAAYVNDRLRGHEGLLLPAVGRSTPSWYAYAFRVKPEVLESVPLERIESALSAEGLAEIDHPGSTRPIHREPLFTEATTAFPWAADSDPGAYAPVAEQFHQSLLKMPMWSESEEFDLLRAYCDGIEKVLSHVDTLAMKG